MNKIVFVPQGNSARLTRFSLINCPQTLYTDGVSSCNVLVAFTEDENRFILMHSDCIDLTYFNETAERLKSQNIQSVYWVYRQGMGAILHDSAKEVFTNEVPEIKIYSHVLSNHHHGISVSFEYQSASKFHPMIKFHGIDDIPKNLIHHPKEQQLTAVVKIREIIGFRALHKYAGSVLPPRTDCIYSWGWKSIPVSEFSIDISKPETKEEMDFFKPSEPLSVVAGKLKGVLDNLEEYMKENEPNFKSDITLHSILVSNAPHLQAYLNNYDHDSLFILDMKEALSHYRSIANAHEKEYIEELHEELGRNQPRVQEVEKIIERFRATLHTSKCKSNILSEYDNFKGIHDERDKYSKNNKYFDNLAEINKTLYQRACKEYKEDKVIEATAKFKLILENSIQYLDDDSRELSSAFYNYGRRLFQQKRFTEAFHILRLCHSTQKCHSKKNNDDKLESSMKKVETMFGECFNEIRKKDKSFMQDELSRLKV